MKKRLIILFTFSFCALIAFFILFFIENNHPQYDRDEFYSVSSIAKKALVKQSKKKKRLKNCNVHEAIGRQSNLEFTEVDLKKQFRKLKPRPWMTAQIEEDFAYYKNRKLSKNRLQTIIAHARKKRLEELQIAYFRIENGKISVRDFCPDPYRTKYFCIAIDKLHRASKLPDMEFAVSFHDRLDGNPFDFPLFVFSKKKENRSLILICDFEALTGFDELDVKIDAASHSFPRESKSEKVFWRGATNGGDYLSPHWKEIPRAKLALLSKKHPDLIDAKFTSFVMGAEGNSEIQNDLEIKGDFVSPEESVRYKYLIDVDGNSCTFSRLYWILRSNSIPFKQMTDNIQWYYRALIPGFHFIPVASDFSDLNEKVLWAQEKEDNAYKISDNARRFVKENLTTAHNYLYLKLVFEKYHSLIVEK